MSVPEILFIVALILAVIDVLNVVSAPRSLTTIAVILVCIGLLYPSFVK